MDKKLKKYMAKIGRKGGQKSRKDIPPEEQKKLQAGRGVPKKKNKEKEEVENEDK